MADSLIRPTTMPVSPLGLLSDNAGAGFTVPKPNNAGGNPTTMSGGRGAPNVVPAPDISDDVNKTTIKAPAAKAKKLDILKGQTTGAPPAIGKQKGNFAKKRDGKR